MKITVSMVALALLPLAAFAESPDSKFYMEAAQGGLAEVELGKLAQEQASSDAVRSFGAQMVTDHSKANAKLMAAAMKQGVALPAAPSAMQAATKTKLAAMKGASFDQAYIEAQVKDHEKTVALLEQEIAAGKDADAKAWAQEALPTVKSHLTMVQAMAAKQHSTH